MIERYAFIKESVWQSEQHIAPYAIELNGYRMIQYASPIDSERLRILVGESGLPMIHYSECTFDIVINGIESGENKVFNCTHEVAGRVCGQYNRGEL